MDDYLSKPVKPDALRAAIERWTKPGAANSGTSSPARLAEHDAHLVDPAVVDQGNRRRVDRRVVERGRQARPGTAARGSTRRSGSACSERAT